MIYRSYLSHGCACTFDVAPLLSNPNQLATTDMDPLDVDNVELTPHRLGYRLQNPEPSMASEIEIGDVGYISQGQYRRLFNATKDADHEVNKHGVPYRFEQFELDHSAYRWPDSELYQGVPHSGGFSPIGVTRLDGDAGVLHYTCMENYAEVVVQNEAVLHHLSGPLENYMGRNYRSWCAFANTLIGGGFRPEDIIFVLELTKISGWPVAVCADSSMNFGKWVEGETQWPYLSRPQQAIPKHGHPHHLGTAREHGQSVSIRLYKLLPRPGLSIVAAETRDSASKYYNVGSSSAIRSNSSGVSGRTMFLEQMSAIKKSHGPLQVRPVFDCISEYSHADYAIATDEALRVLFRFIFSFRHNLTCVGRTGGLTTFVNL
ncbi:hypothetical protein B0H21DRAFT_550868 [Amylocystis lapponica]|nr:hypothetical protein B0H21DRAFT_550868 [Amylocystis lapponica]